MRALLLAAALAAGVSNAAWAQERVSDSDYVALARCAGLALATEGDVQAANAAVNQARRDRADHVRDRASQARRDAMSEVRRADGQQRAALVAERDSRCAAYQARALGDDA